MNSISRRGFVGMAGLSAAALGAGGKVAIGAGGEPSRTFEHGSPLGEFNYGQVQFQPGLHQSQLEQTHGVLMSLDEDSLLRPFRARAGLDAPGVELGGWYSSDGFVPGHLFGQWLSAFSKYYAITGDEPTRAKVHRLVEAFAATVEPQGKFYKRYPAARGYTYDLLAFGLIEAHQLARQPAALQALAATTRAAARYLPGKSTPMHSDSLVCEPDEKCYDHIYVIPENQFIAWQQSGDALHLAMARQYMPNEIFDPLARGENVLGGLHAYTHLNALCSAAKAYLVLGDEKYLRAAKNGFAFIDEQSFATGGWGPNEMFTPIPADDKAPAIPTLGDSLGKTRKSFETPCGAWSHFKLARYLLRLTKDSRYGDSMERVMYNTVLGAKPLQKDGRAFYYADYSPGARKTYLTEYLPAGKGPEMALWPCCAGSLPQIAGDYRISAYFQDAGGVYVNLYIPSTLRWRQQGEEVSLSQTGQYPLADGVTFDVTAGKPSAFALRLRIPAWAQNPSISINGKRVASVQPGAFATLKREWRSGDRIELELPRSLALKPIDAHHSNTVALTYGPLVLFALAGETPKATRQQLLSAKREAGEAWRIETAGGPLRLVPWWAIQEETYATYLSVA